MTVPKQGKCLCGACRFTAVPEPTAGVCHCGMCRKWSGGMFIGVQCGDSLSFVDGAPVKTFLSSEWGRRLFCSDCGSTLAWQTADGTMTAVSIQAFDDPGAFPVVSEIFYDEKPGNYALAGDTKKMTGAEVIAMFAPPEGS
ncbi:MAG: GFA family protein [Marinibacterium sp.]